MLRIVLIVLMLFIIGCKGKSTNTQKSEYLDYYKVCLDNHLYWQSYGNTSSGLAGILDDNGNPVKCEEK